MSSLKNSQRPHADSPDLRILKIGPKEQPFGSGYNTSIRRWAMRPTELVSASRVAILSSYRRRLAKSTSRSALSS